jgi:tetratricopeptide (TPR) repeat protein
VALENGEESDEKEQLFQIAHELIKQENFEAAIEELVHDNLKIRKKYAGFPNHVWYCMGNIYFRTEQYDQSIRYFSKAIRSFPADLNAWLALGNSYSEYGLYKEAASCFFTILVLDSSNNVAKYNFACANMDMGDFEKAMYFFNKIPKKDEKIKKNVEICKRKLLLQTK